MPVSDRGAPFALHVCFGIKRKAALNSKSFLRARALEMGMGTGSLGMLCLRNPLKDGGPASWFP
jgi:hypothetical protein